MRSNMKLISRFIQIHGRGGIKFSAPRRIATEIIRTYGTNPQRETELQGAYGSESGVRAYSGHLVPPGDPYRSYVFTCGSGGLSNEDLKVIWIAAAEASQARMGAMGPELDIPPASAPSRGGGVSAAFLSTLAAYDAIVGLDSQDMSRFEMDTRLIGTDRVALFAHFSEGQSHWPWAMFIHSLRMQILKTAQSVAGSESSADTL